MLIFYACLIVLVCAVFDAILFKAIRLWETRKLEEIRQREERLNLSYKELVKETQKLKAEAESLRLAQAASEPEEPSIAPPPPTQNRKINIPLQLLQKGIISREQLQKAKQYQKSMGTGKPIEEILILLGSLDQEALDAIAQT